MSPKSVRSVGPRPFGMHRALRPAQPCPDVRTDGRLATPEARQDLVEASMNATELRQVLQVRPDVCQRRKGGGVRGRGAR